MLLTWHVLSRITVLYLCPFMDLWPHQNPETYQSVGSILQVIGLGFLLLTTATCIPVLTRKRGNPRRFILALITLIFATLSVVHDLSLIAHSQQSFRVFLRTHYRPTQRRSPKRQNGDCIHDLDHIARISSMVFLLHPEVSEPHHHALNDKNTMKSSHPMTQDDVYREFHAKAKRVKRVQFYLFIPFTLGVTGMFIKLHSDYLSAILITLAILSILLLIIASNIDWSCPACRKMFHKMGPQIHFCPHCGVALVKEGKRKQLKRVEIE